MTLDDDPVAREVEALMVALAGGDRLGGIVREHLASGGRRARARLALAAAEALGVDRTDAAPWAAACELLHNAALVHDDVQDGDVVRRGAPATWARHGTAQAVNAGDLLLMSATTALASLRSSDSAKWALAAALARRAEQAVRGQADEIGLRGRMCTWADWSAAARAKSGALMALPVEGAALLAGHPARDAIAAAAPFETLGELYQAWDDVRDLFGSSGRARGGDLREGKPSALVVEHLTCNPQDHAALALAGATEDGVSAWVERLIEGAMPAVLARIEVLEAEVLAHPVWSVRPELAGLAAEIVATLRRRSPVGG